MKRSLRYLVLPAALLGTIPAHAEDRPNYDAYYDRAAAAAVSPKTPLPAAAIDGAASSFDARRAVPRFLRASRKQPLPAFTASASKEAAARFYLKEYAHRYGLPPAALDNAEVASVHDVGRGGIIVTFRQQIDGVEVFRGDVKVLMARNLELVALSGSPRGSAAAETKRRGKAFKVGEAEALANAFKDLYRVSLKPSSFLDLKRTVAAYSYFDLGPTPEVKAAAVHLVEPTRIKKVFFPMPEQLVPAYFLELLASKPGQATPDAFAYVIAAADGRVLYRQNLTEHDAFKYRVFVDSDGRPLDGPQEDYTPHPTGTPDGSTPDFISPILILTEGFNHNALGLPDPWLPADAGQTLGNNVDAYTDDDTPDGYSNGDIRATVTAPQVFDRTYDTSVEPQANQNQSMAAVVQLFYTNNWLHDWWYDSGFNEAAGNAQQDNFGRGGLGGDVLNAQGQDGALVGNRDNANMSTFADGNSPRMQMFLSTNFNDVKRSLVVASTGATIPSNGADFGPRTFDLTGELALVADGAGPSSTDACEPLVNAAGVAGKIALIDRGSCGFVIKVQHAVDAGAVGVLVVNNVANVPPPKVFSVAPFDPILIPILSTTKEDGAALKATLQTGPESVHFVRVPSPEPDGTIDNSVIAHEWGHYLHHRLVNCGLQLCGGMSEGWGDFTALQLHVRPGDNLAGTYGLMAYSTLTGPDDPYYSGVRRYPYSTDMTKNGLTFKHITDGVELPEGLDPGNNSEVHNTGEIWASMLFEGFVALLKVSEEANPRYTFEEARRAMSDYVVAGMKLTPVEPTITEQRDAILAAAYAAEPKDADLLALAFAKRGAGSCAVSPPNDSVDNTGVVESFEVKANFKVISLAIDDSIKSCDKDGILDADEIGKATVKVVNTSGVTLSNTAVTLSTSTPGVVFPNGPTFTVPTIEPFGDVTVTVDIGLDSTVTTAGFLDLTADVTNAAGCTPTSTLPILPRINYDNLASSAKIDTVESDIAAWAIVGTDADQIWSRTEPKPQNHVWHGVDFGSLSDTQLTSPALDVSANEPFVISFKHRHQFETDPTTYWDGGVIEISEDNGVTWEDISAYADPGYGGVIGNEAQNPILNRNAFVDHNPSWPEQDLVSLDLGKQLAGKSVKVRFRIGSDLGVGDFGWELDDLAFSGITNTPFPTVIDDASKCLVPHAPVADAGADQTVTGGDAVTLDGSKSSDPDNDKLTFTWTQTAGFIVPLADAATAKPSFTTPEVFKDTLFSYKLTVSDGTATAEDSVDILVKPVSGTPSSSSSSGGSSGEGGSSGVGGSSGEGGSGGSASTSSGGGEPSGGGCGCSTPGADMTGGSIGASLLGLALLVFRRRRERAPRVR